MFSLQLALLKGSKRFDTLKKQLLEIASALEDQTGIPTIAQQAVLIEEIQTDQWWEGGIPTPDTALPECGRM
jgi:type I restriction enzyme R subunit